jgi:hypothetical protein
MDVLHMLAQIVSAVLGNTAEHTPVETAPVIQLLDEGIQTVHALKT